MIASFRSKALRQFWEEGNRRGLRPDLVERILDRLTLLHAATELVDIDVPGARFHSLQGVTRRYAIRVNRNWRITFSWSEGDAIDVDLEDYN